ncbi:hypothetical protein COT97_04130 [Candidatus Falkowbacteria bacterium CG10_big_fil_rev_8_21_14_0_10_39_11]|uniref:Uncharacterized protein n=1 Tax=Candidatus Falkowbacteria bacterium CG10_big_fil_rev_8_21_14_0_10_39_11 TaxID=1974565 RepID=A0A2H0V4A4_9BACT|nr:MAG: hypothetical protein COT97_04130 [Candidatus Falkowbacteria bacterium CG10_big_fil_rev_8_21_14_0_10_39_11]
MKLEGVQPVWEPLDESGGPEVIRRPKENRTNEKTVIDGLDVDLSERERAKVAQKAQQSSRKSVELVRRRGQSLRDSVQSQDFDNVVSAIINTSEDITFQERKRELLESFNIESFVASLPKEVYKMIEDFRSFRGYVFEYIAKREFNSNEKNSLLAEFILECLTNPHLFELGPAGFRSPDNLGVVVDVERKVAYITGMYEVKFGGVAHKTTTKQKVQRKRFYGDLQRISERINSHLKRLKDKYHVDFIPAGGITVLAQDEMDKFYVYPMPKDASDLRRVGDKRKALQRLGWKIRTSVFSQGDIEILTAFIMNFAEERKVQPRYEEFDLREDGTMIKK